MSMHEKQANENLQHPQVRKDAGATSHRRAEVWIHVSSEASLASASQAKRRRAKSRESDGSIIFNPASFQIAVPITITRFVGGSGRRVRLFASDPR